MVNRREFLRGAAAAATATALRPSWMSAQRATPLRFPDHFLWGVATSAYQIEGAVHEDGRGESVWDRFSHTPGKTKFGQNGDIACDHYHRWKEDLALLKSLGLTSYRFSTAWPRIQPSGSGKANPKGVDFYSRLVDELLRLGIRPLPTLYHWDLPTPLEDAGGWPNRDTAARFADYADIVARALADRAQVWAIFNEPFYFCWDGYYTGVHAPGRQNFWEMMRATHVANLAQGGAFRAIKAANAKALVTSALPFSPQEPETDSPRDGEAAERAHALRNLWFVETALHGRYPEAFVGCVPEKQMDIRSGDMEAVRAPFDFFAINVYGRSVVAYDLNHDEGKYGLPWTSAKPERSGPLTDVGWEVWPECLHDVVARLWHDYRLPIEVTETGCAYNEWPGPDGVVHDQRRIAFYDGYLRALHRAMQEGAEVRSFHAWTLLDNFEWHLGYNQRFGLVYVDFPTQRRTIKESGRWLAGVVAANGLPGEISA